MGSNPAPSGIHVTATGQHGTVKNGSCDGCGADNIPASNVKSSGSSGGKSK